MKWSGSGRMFEWFHLTRNLELTFSKLIFSLELTFPYSHSIPASLTHGIPYLTYIRAPHQVTHLPLSLSLPWYQRSTTRHRRSLIDCIHLRFCHCPSHNVVQIALSRVFAGIPQARTFIIIIIILMSIIIIIFNVIVVIIIILIFVNIVKINYCFCGRCYLSWTK